MWATVSSLTLAAVLTTNPPTRPPYPDTSDPRAAAFSLAVALAKGDAKTAKAVYDGSDKGFLDLIDASAKAKAAADRYNRAVADRYGPDYADMFAIRPGNLDLKVNRQSLAVLLADGEVVQKGNEAAITVAGRFSVELRRDDGGWRVTEWPETLSPAFFAAYDRRVAAVVAAQAEEVERGKHPKPWDAARAFRRAYAAALVAGKK